MKVNRKLEQCLFKNHIFFYSLSLLYFLQAVTLNLKTATVVDQEEENIDLNSTIHTVAGQVEKNN